MIRLADTLDTCTASSIATTLRLSIVRHGLTYSSVARHMGVSSSLLKQWCDADNPRTIQTHRVGQLPPVVRRDVVAWLNDLDNCIAVERVDDHADGETARELAGDVVIAANGFFHHARTGEGDARRLHDELTRTVARARPGLRKSRPPMAKREAEVA